MEAISSTPCRASCPGATVRPAVGGSLASPCILKGCRRAPCNNLKSAVLQEPRRLLLSRGVVRGKKSVVAGASSNNGAGKASPTCSPPLGSVNNHGETLVNGARVVDNGTAVEDEAVADPDLKRIMDNVASIDQQEQALLRQINHLSSLMRETSKILSDKAQASRIETAKLRKAAYLQQVAEMKRTQELRKQGELRAQQEWNRIEELRKAEEARQRKEQEQTPQGQQPPQGQSGSNEGGGGKESTNSTSRQQEEQSSTDAILGPDAVATPERLECMVSHPGALSCTKTVIKHDKARQAAVVTMETSVRCAGDACLSGALDMEDYIALAIQSLADAATDLKRSRTQQAVGSDPLTQEKHKSLVNLLARGALVSSKPVDPPSKFGHESFVVQLADKSGKMMTALFKPAVVGDAEGWHRAPIEWVAYELNRMLGMDYIPPVAYRTGGVDVEHRRFDEGAFVHFVNKAQPLKRVAAANWGLSVARLLSDTRILDVLLNNSDRHHGHFLFGEHWVDGKMHPILIDHAAGFRKEAVVHMEHENAFQTGSVKCVSAKTYLRLRFLDKQLLMDKFSGVLQEDEVDLLMKRRDMILEYLDKLVQERGYHRTVIE